MKEISCQEPWFSKIKIGDKKIEGRKYSTSLASLKSGEILKFCCNERSFLTEVVKIVNYSSLEDYLNAEGIENVLPGIESFAEAVNIYLKFNDREKLDNAGGFLAIHIKVVE